MAKWQEVSWWVPAESIAVCRTLEAIRMAETMLNLSQLQESLLQAMAQGPQPQALPEWQIGAAAD